jgi:hypothetical protein
MTRTVEFITATTMHINAALAAMPVGAEHLRPIWEAIRDVGLGLTIVPQGGKLGLLSKRARQRPRITIVGDDLYSAMGPDGFSKKTLGRVFNDAAAVFLMSGLRVEAYAAAVADAVLLGHHVIIIETRVEQETKWLAHVYKHAPVARLIIATPNLANYSQQRGRA